MSTVLVLVVSTRRTADRLVGETLSTAGHSHRSEQPSLTGRAVEKAHHSWHPARLMRGGLGTLARLSQLAALLGLAVAPAQSASSSQFDGRWSVLVVTDRGIAPSTAMGSSSTTGRLATPALRISPSAGPSPRTGRCGPASRAAATAQTFAAASAGGPAPGCGARPAVTTARVIGRRNAAPDPKRSDVMARASATNRSGATSA